MNVTRPDPATPVDLVALQAQSPAALAAMAAALDLQLPPGLDHGELVFALFEFHLGSDGIGWIEGILDMHADGFGFLRSVARSFQPQPYDVHVNPSQVRKLNLKPGHRIAGPVRGPRGGERFFALQHVDSVNGAVVAALDGRVPFAARTPILPHTRLHLGAAAGTVESGAPEPSAIDRVAPWGKGQRVLVTSPPNHGRALFLVDIGQAMRRNHPELQITVCLLDQRPEDCATAQRLGAENGIDVVASTFDEPPARHVSLAELVLARAQREVEAQRDVVLLFDSLTALARASNIALVPSGRLSCAGLDAFATAGGKRLFSAARACAEGGSLSIVATAVDDDNRIDQAILGDFRYRGNSEVVFISEDRPTTRGATLDVLRTVTRTEDLLLSEPALAALRRLRHELASVAPGERLATCLAARPAQDGGRQGR